jgi:hypothetical protein
MAPAAILSLDEFRDTQRCAEIRQRLHDRLDHWLDTLEARVKDTKPTLEQLDPGRLSPPAGVDSSRHRGVGGSSPSGGDGAAHGGMPSVRADVVGPWSPGPYRGDAGGSSPTPAPLLLL